MAQPQFPQQPAQQPVPQPQRPMSIFEVINQNIYTMNENLHTAMQQIADLSQQVANTQQEVIALSLMFKAPEQPNVASGNEGAATETVGSATNN